MLKELSSVQAYLPFIHAMLADPDFCDPMLATPAQLHQHLLVLRHYLRRKYLPLPPLRLHHDAHHLTGQCPEPLATAG